VRAALQKGWITQQQADELPIPKGTPTRDPTLLSRAEMREMADKWMFGSGRGERIEDVGGEERRRPASAVVERGLIPHASFAEYKSEKGQMLSGWAASLILRGGEYTPPGETKPQKYVGLERGYRQFRATLKAYPPAEVRAAWIGALIPHRDLMSLWLKKHPNDANEVQKQSANAPPAPALPPSYPQPTEEEYRGLGGGSSRPG